MTEDEFDTLVDDATHAVNNLIPDRLLDALASDARSGLLMRINDALTPILRELADDDDADGESEDRDAGLDRRTSTIAAFLRELVETHIAKCDEAGDDPNDRPPHFASEAPGAQGNIDSIASCDIETGSCIYLVLEGGAAFRIVIEPAEAV
ncbi:hypothetical protein GCM10007897_24230 [Sphingobium jiangsuense]|uniref:Uncharacterized protein n=1 Tax=Sphingobium jiangsuense TaxID=870476 RepID=A0A7W6FSC8_9SPHN|nr:hypothetical protein [Sphingobium jiangsuense]MBB3928602.1 hypothetical protein [Sphingobium jiangsuense]GLT01032.1 hypothetical protein GCM10007897_24230 [Sphingobium jiangsuense]